MLLRLDRGIAIDRRTGAVHPFGGGIDLEGGEAAASARWDVGAFHAQGPAEQYMRAVAQARGYTHAGDIFQANVAHRLVATMTGSARALAAELFEKLDPSFPCYLELPEQETTVVSVSPELFLHAAPDTDGAWRVVTRPIKGTRAGAHSEGLARSRKDAAELAMIVDLMRNDLGRVARGGSVKVDDARSIEVHHAGHIAHTVATVSAALRDGVSLGDLLRATMPPGSVTGAPKVRALQIIEELERPMFGGPRGAYCGGLGYLADGGGLTLNVGIRTLTIEQDRISLPVGAGIVADSKPRAEWDETLAKAAPIVAALGSALSL
ncbi:MAG: anthranilate synthase component I family protein [Phycisphaerales bacterium]|nr:anthranilate synthase component I family protein [Phycisphaerales bacterium]